MKTVSVNSIEYLQIKHPLFGAFMSGIENDLHTYFPLIEDSSYYWVRVAKLFQINTQEIEKVIAVDGVCFDVLSPVLYIILKTHNEYLYIKSEFYNAHDFPDLVKDPNNLKAYLQSFSTLKEVQLAIKTDTDFYSYLFDQRKYQESVNYYNYISGLTILDILCEKEEIEFSMNKALKEETKKLKV